MFTQIITRFNRFCGLGCFNTKFNLKTFIAFMLLFPVLSSAGGVLRLEPENPVVGEIVRLYYYDCEPPFPHVESGELFYTERSDNLVQFVGYFTFSQPLCPVRFEQYYDLGEFQEGEYELEIYLFLADFPLDLDLNNITSNEVISFGVTAPVSVPINNYIGLFSLLASLLFITHLHKRRLLCSNK